MVIVTRTRRPRNTQREMLNRFARFRAEKIEFIPNELFNSSDASEIVLTRALTPLQQVRANTGTTSRPTSRLRRLPDFELLPPDEEAETFRRMNYWKHQAASLRERLHRSTPDRESVREFESLLAEARGLRDRIIQANLRLVMSMAKKFVDANNSFDDLLSEGTMALLRAVEKFDYARGFRFSTYATYAIRRSLYRFVVARRQEKMRFDCRSDDLPDASVREAEPRITEEHWHELHRRLTAILRQLDPREQLVIRARFGLGDQAKAETLQSLADRMGVCKERVRQLEKRAMMKLRTMADKAALEDPGQ